MTISEKPKLKLHAGNTSTIYFLLFIHHLVYFVFTKQSYIELKIFKRQRFKRKYSLKKTFCLKKIIFFRMLGFDGRAIVHTEAAYNPGKVKQTKIRAIKN